MNSQNRYTILFLADKSLEKRREDGFIEKGKSRKEITIDTDILPSAKIYMAQG
jgi:hypothetical protein